MASCPFCDIAAGMTDTKVSTHGSDVISFIPLGPVARGHRLFVPRVHVPHAATIPAITGRVFAEAAAWAREQASHFNLITNAGSAATQTIPHLHVHYVPRHRGDNLALPWTEPKHANS